MCYSKHQKFKGDRHKIWGQVIFVLLFLVTIFYISTINFEKPFVITQNCFEDHKNPYDKLDKHKLDDILLSDYKPKKGKSIFFHETSCSQNGQLELNARQACAIESAALLNPNLDIFVLFASPRVQFNQNTSLTKNSLNIKILLNTYKNIYLRNVNLWRYADGTPISKWLQNGELFKSNYLVSHISDFLRYVTLWRWGGTYLDLDFIIIKTLENLKPNYAGAESKYFVAAGILNFNNDILGHSLAKTCLKEFEEYFIGTLWGQNGPGIITRVLTQLCQTGNTKLMTRNRCFGFKVYGEEAFYAIGWWNWTYLFYEEYLRESLYLTNKSIAIHAWNQYSKNHNIRVGSKIAFGIYADKYCPKIYRSCGTRKYF